MHLPTQYHDQHIVDVFFELQGKWKWRMSYQLFLSNSLLPEAIEIEDFEMVLKNAGCRSNIKWMFMLNYIATYYIYCQPHSSD
jgi:hypothetical protein